MMVVVEATAEEEGAPTEVEAPSIKREEAVSSNNSNNNRRISLPANQVRVPTSM
jgi:hypothetical protein